jgi:hypothetical protein
VLSRILICSLVDGRGGLLVWGLCDVLTTPHRKKLLCDETLTVLRMAHELNNSSDRKNCLFYPAKISDFDKLLSEFARTPVVVKCTFSEINT